ncbi:MAG: hypothetical protein FWC68_05125 [Oscillospiraceae bacterium]|nr:hypothetical protein [Oscillospiraceae bacterium]
MTNQKGITLIALVITIIVMLILAGVTIAIVVQGGLFGQAQTAVEETQNAQIREAVVIATGTYLGEIHAPGVNRQATAIAADIVRDINAIVPNAAAVGTGTDTNVVTVTFRTLPNGFRAGAITLTVTEDGSGVATGLTQVQAANTPANP